MSIQLLSYIIAGLIAVWGVLLVWGIVALLRRLNRAAESRLHFSPIKWLLGIIIVGGILAWVGNQLFTNTQQALQVGGTIVAIIAGILALGGIASLNDWLAKRIGREEINAGTLLLAEIGLFVIGIGLWINALVTVAVIAVLVIGSSLLFGFRTANDALKQRLPFAVEWFWLGLWAVIAYGIVLYFFTSSVLQYTGYAAIAIAALAAAVFGIVGLHRFLKWLLPFPVVNLWLGLVVLGIYAAFFTFLRSPTVQFTIVVVGGAALIGLIYGTHRLLKPRLPFDVAFVWIGLVLLGAYGGGWYAFPAATGFFSAAVGLMAAVGLLVWGLIAGNAWVTQRYNINPFALLLNGLIWLLLAGLVVGVVGVIGYAAYQNQQEALILGGVIGGIALTGFTIYWLNKWLDPILKQRFDTSFKDVATGIVVLLIAVVGIVATGRGIAADWENFVSGLRMFAIVIGVFMAGVVALIALTLLFQWLMRRARVSALVLGARLLLIPLTAGAIYMLVVYGNYAAMLTEGSVVSGEILALEDNGTTHRVQYTYDPNRGDPPDVRTQWQTVPEAFYEDREKGQSIPIYFLSEDKDNSSVTVVTDALESSMLATVLILGTPLWALGLFIHWRRTRTATAPQPAAETEQTDDTPPDTADLQQSPS